MWEQGTLAGNMNMGFFLILSNIILLIIVIAVAVVMNVISLYANQNQTNNQKIQKSTNAQNTENKHYKNMEWVKKNPKTAARISIGLSLIIIVWIIVI